MERFGYIMDIGLKIELRGTQFFQVTSLSALYINKPQANNLYNY